MPAGPRKALSTCMMSASFGTTGSAYQAGTCASTLRPISNAPIKPLFSISWKIIWLP